MSDTIAAISTAFGRAGISVIRISGEMAIEIAGKVFLPASRKKFSDLKANSIVYGDILYDGERIDDGCVSIFRAPHSYTGEDVVEISCHGGVLLTAKVLESILKCGARSAGPGEFSKRAFLNGKIGLTQAESVIDLIDAESNEAIKIAASGSSGLLDKEISGIRNQIENLISAAYVQCDWPDEDLSDLSIDDSKKELIDILKNVDDLLSTYSYGKAVIGGIETVICGAPNTGKSSLLNLLLGDDRAIVSDIPGTTRDTIEEKCSLGRVLLKLCDTAGVRDSDDEIENLGIDRTNKKIESSELIIAVFDSSKMIDENDKKILKLLNPDKCIIVLNKADLPLVIEKEQFSGFKNIVEMSCKNKEGIDELVKTVETMFVSNKIDYNKAIVSNVRQYSCLLNAKELIEKAKESVDSGATMDVAGLDLELALSKLGEIDGASVSDGIVKNIFSRFCVGK